LRHTDPSGLAANPRPPVTSEIPEYAVTFELTRPEVTVCENESVFVRLRIFSRRTGRPKEGVRVDSSNIRGIGDYRIEAWPFSVSDKAGDIYWKITGMNRNVPQGNPPALHLFESRIPAQIPLPPNLPPDFKVPVPVTDWKVRAVLTIKVLDAKK
jgi:hypothetical protein